MATNKIEWNLKTAHFIKGCMHPECETVCPHIGTINGSFIHVCPNHGIFLIDEDGEYVEKEFTWTHKSYFKFEE